MLEFADEFADLLLSVGDSLLFLSDHISGLYHSNPDELLLGVCLGAYATLSSLGIV